MKNRFVDNDFSEGKADINNVRIKKMIGMKWRDSIWLKRK